MGKYPFSEIQDKRREGRRPKPKFKVIKISRRTKQGAKDDRLYNELRKQFLEENPFCQCGQPGCTKIATQCHHRKGRGILLLVIKFFLAVCDSCHKKIESSPEWAKENGFSLLRLAK